jgi:hypothetical protein
VGCLGGVGCVGDVEGGGGITQGLSAVQTNFARIHQLKYRNKGDKESLTCRF